MPKAKRTPKKTASKKTITKKLTTTGEKSLADEILQDEIQEPKVTEPKTENLPEETTDKVEESLQTAPHPPETDDGKDEQEQEEQIKEVVKDAAKDRPGKPHPIIFWVKNVALAGKTAQGSIEKEPFKIKFDEAGISEDITDRKVYDKLVAVGCEPIAKSGQNN